MAGGCVGGGEGNSRIRVVWLSGLPSSGKTTLGSALRDRLLQGGIASQLLDGDELRRSVCKDLGFTLGDRLENSRRAAFIAAYLMSRGILPVVSMITPYRSIRSEIRKLLGAAYCEVYLDCSVEICRERDCKGLYRRAERGEIAGFTGVDAPFEPPEDPELIIATGTKTIGECLESLCSFVLSKIVAGTR